MCFGDDARPPLPPVRGGAVDSDDLVLTSGDGTDFAAFDAHPDAPSSAGAVILPDARGLCRRLAPDADLHGPVTAETS